MMKKINQPLPKKQVSEHLSELRNRILWIILFLVVGTAVGFLIYPHITSIILYPLHTSVYYSSPSGALDFTLNISLVFGFLISVPIILYQVLKFIEPVLPQSSQKRILTYVFVSYLLLILGIVFAYIYVIPAMLHFLNSFNTKDLKPLISTNEYFSFFKTYLLEFGLLFQLPIILVILNKITPKTLFYLLKYQKYIVGFTFIITLVLTPTPDVVTQLIMALPVVALYYLTVLYLKFS